MPRTPDAVTLSAAHVDAVNRHRCVVQNFDVLLVDPSQYDTVEDIVKHRFMFIDDPTTHTDSIWWNWCEGNVVPYPSKFLPRYNEPGYQKWCDERNTRLRVISGV